VILKLFLFLTLGELTIKQIKDLLYKPEKASSILLTVISANSVSSKGERLMSIVVGIKPMKTHLSIAEIDEALLGFAALIILFGSFMAFLFYYLGR
jgi:hypothetical protein